MKLLKILILTFPISIFTFFILGLFISWEEIQNFQGYCPGAPTDIPPYPCTFPELIIRLFFSPWVLAVAIMVYPIWLLIHFVIIYSYIKIFKSDNE